MRPVTRENDEETFSRKPIEGKSRDTIARAWKFIRDRNVTFHVRVTLERIIGSFTSRFSFRSSVRPTIFYGIVLVDVQKSALTRRSN